AADPRRAHRRARASRRPPARALTWRWSRRGRCRSPARRARPPARRRPPRGRRRRRPGWRAAAARCRRLGPHPRRGAALRRDRLSRRPEGRRMMADRPIVAALSAISLAIGLVAAGCSSPATSAPTAPSSPAPPPAASSAGGPSTGASTCPKAAPPHAAAGSTAIATITTPKGTIVIKLEADLGPAAVGNFIALAGCGFYDGVVFHRLVPGFVIQGGDGQFGRSPNVDRARVGQGGPGYTIDDDPVTAQYGRGVVA